MQKYYIDSCIWIDYLEDRKDRYRPLGEWALMLINKIIDEKNIVVISNHLINELKKALNDEKAKNAFSVIPKNLIEYMEFNYEHVRKASEIRKRFGIPKSDSLHWVLAAERNAILVTRENHFKPLKEIAKISKPEELI
jgi:predicted nucleic acid-binding protein